VTSGKIKLLILLSLVSIFFLSCAAGRKLTPTEMKALEKDFRMILKEKARDQHNSAYLMQVKIKTPDIKKKFKLEIYFQNDSVSFYSPGFLGKGTFKGVIYGDSLVFYLPSEKSYYRGLWYNLTEPDLNRWRDAFELTFNILRGDFLPPDSGSSAPRKYNIKLEEGKNEIRGKSSNWDYEFLFNGDRLKNAIYGWAKDILLANFKVKSYGDEFPFFKLDMVKIIYRNDLQRQKDRSLEKFTSEMRIDFIDQRYNIEIPPEKFELEIPASAEKIEGLILE
jgi:hypothetical protein